MTYEITRWKRTRFWAVKDINGKLVAVLVYKKGAVEIKRILERVGTYSNRRINPQQRF